MPRTARAEAPLTREELARELLELRQIYQPYEARDGEICALLKQSAAEGESFKIMDKLGRVSVSAPQPKRLTGTAPEVVVEKFLALQPREQKALIRQGIVRIADVTKDAYSGRVNVELF